MEDMSARKPPGLNSPKGPSTRSRTVSATPSLGVEIESIGDAQDQSTRTKTTKRLWRDVVAGVQPVNQVSGGTAAKEPNGSGDRPRCAEDTSEGARARFQEAICVPFAGSYASACLQGQSSGTEGAFSPTTQPVVHFAARPQDDPGHKFISREEFYWGPRNEEIEFDPAAPYHSWSTPCRNVCCSPAALSPNAWKNRPNIPSSMPTPSVPQPTANPVSCPPHPMANPVPCPPHATTNLQSCCNFCQSRKLSAQICWSHTLHDAKGNVMCQNFQKIVCSICQATGIKAHTPRYCPTRQARSKTAKKDEAH